MRTDLELLAAWRGGDSRAGEELVSRYWASLSGFFRAKLGDEAAELIAETFLACVEGKDRIEGELRAYLFAIARRRLADHFRKRAHAPELDVLRSSLVDLATGPVTEVGRREQGALLRQGLARIPLDDQIALELAYFERLTTRELAAVLEIPENTVRSRLSRARDKLRTVLVELGTPEAASLAESQLDTDQGK
ncbi:MAG TPA: sigma-70 family RNA polymerase sigma factor [Kofleriaceae bacterium]|nr:sigma-70 family RNA polymerase sigma factor [Kofleriaceae bacterium]